MSQPCSSHNRQKNLKVLQKQRQQVLLLHQMVQSSPALEWQWLPRSGPQASWPPALFGSPSAMAEVGHTARATCFAVAMDNCALSGCIWQACPAHMLILIRPGQVKTIFRLALGTHSSSTKELGDRYSSSSSSCARIFQLLQLRGTKVAVGHSNTWALWSHALIMSHVLQCCKTAG